MSVVDDANVSNEIHFSIKYAFFNEAFNYHLEYRNKQFLKFSENKPCRYNDVVLKGL